VYKKNQTVSPDSNTDKILVIGRAAVIHRKNPLHTYYLLQSETGMAKPMLEEFCSYLQKVKHAPRLPAAPCDDNINKEEHSESADLRKANYWMISKIWWDFLVHGYIKRKPYSDTFQFDG